MIPSAVNIQYVAKMKRENYTMLSYLVAMEHFSLMYFSKGFQLHMFSVACGIGAFRVNFPLVY